MEKGYYTKVTARDFDTTNVSQSTIKMEKGYYDEELAEVRKLQAVSIHNKNGKGLLQEMHVPYYLCLNEVAIHNKNGKGLLQNTNG